MAEDPVASFPAATAATAAAVAPEPKSFPQRRCDCSVASRSRRSSSFLSPARRLRAPDPLATLADPLDSGLRPLKSKYVERAPALRACHLWSQSSSLQP